MEVEPLIGQSQQKGCCHCPTWIFKAVAVFWLLVIPFSWAAAVLAFLLGPIGLPIALGIGLGIPTLALMNLFWQVCLFDPDPYEKVGIAEFTINGVRATFFNYYKVLMAFLVAASSMPNWRSEYFKWFEKLGEDMPPGTGSLPTGGGGTLYYKHAVCKGKLGCIGPGMAAGTVKRESHLALAVFNNVSWPTVGRMVLGMTQEDHAFLRPLLDQMVGPRAGWSSEVLKSQFKALFQATKVLEHNQRNSHRFVEPFFPSWSKNTITQWCLKVLHKVALDIDLTDAQMQELAALQTVSLAVGALTSRSISMFIMWAFFTKPLLVAREKYLAMYRPFIKRRFPDVEWTDRKLEVVASGFLDAMMFAGGRSVPLAIDLVMGYILTKNKPECIKGIDFKKESSILLLLMEAMRFHPVVTTVPYWVKTTSTSTGHGWEHQAVCIDRALADPDVFPDPETFKLREDASDASKSIAWAEFGAVNGENGNPNSFGCPAKELSIQMVLAFVEEYHAAGPWRVTDDITLDYYGTREGFTCTKA